MTADTANLDKIAFDLVELKQALAAMQQDDLYRPIWRVNYSTDALVLALAEAQSAPTLVARDSKDCDQCPIQPDCRRLVRSAPDGLQQRPAAHRGGRRNCRLRTPDGRGKLLSAFLKEHLERGAS